MAYLCYFLVAVAVIVALISPAQALTCSSQKFGKRVFEHCDDLPHLDAYIHWTYNSTNSSLSVAFQAPPEKPGGWVAWAINPTATGMAGAQAMLSSLANGAPAVRTFNISGYSSIVPSPKLAFDFWGLSAEHSDGKFTIFATVKVPPKARSVNQVWQVGSAVNATSGAPTVHEFKPANLNSKGVLAFVKTSGGRSSSADGNAPASAPAPSPGDGVGAGAGRGDRNGAESTIGSKNLGFFVGLYGLIWAAVLF